MRHRTRSLAWLDDLILSALRPGERVRFGEIVRRTEAHPSSVATCVTGRTGGCAR